MKNSSYDIIFKEMLLLDTNKDILMKLIQQILGEQIIDIKIMYIYNSIKSIQLNHNQLILELQLNYRKTHIKIDNVNEQYITCKKNVNSKNHSISVIYIQINYVYGKTLKKHLKPLIIYKLTNNNLGIYIESYIICNVYFEDIYYFNNSTDNIDNIKNIILGLDNLHTNQCMI